MSRSQLTAPGSCIVKMRSAGDQLLHLHASQMPQASLITPTSQPLCTSSLRPWNLKSSCRQPMPSQLKGTLFGSLHGFRASVDPSFLSFAADADCSHHAARQCLKMLRLDWGRRFHIMKAYSCTPPAAHGSQLRSFCQDKIPDPLNTQSIVLVLLLQAPHSNVLCDSGDTMKTEFNELRQLVELQKAAPFWWQGWQQGPCVH